MEIHEAGLSMDLAELMFETRVGAGMTQAQIAAALGTSKSEIDAWESGTKCRVSTCWNAWLRYAASGCISVSTSTDPGGDGAGLTHH